MPYSREKASKGGHSDLVKNPAVASFLLDCDFMRPPTEEEAKAIASTYLPAPTLNYLPKKTAASDASPYSEPLDGKFPSTQIGYVKVSLVLINLRDFDGLTPPGSRFVDPFKLAELHRNADAFSFVLPGSNIRYRNATSVQDGFRQAVWEQLSDDRTRLSKNPEFTVRGTLLALDDGEVGLKRCPSCGKGSPLGITADKFSFTAGNEVQQCPDCGSTVYLTDSLRIHEQITDYGDCSSAVTRFMNAAEQLLMATLVRMLAHDLPKALSEMAFIMDGPLAVFGQPASISFSLVKLYHQIGQDLQRRGLPPPVIIGLQKDGQVMEHARALEPFLPENTYRVVDDEYRNRYINAVNNDNFGTETYFGQDFIFKSGKGRIFTVGIPYPAPKKSGTKEFSQLKSDVTNYGDQIAKAFDVIRYFELDLYDNAVVPVALAHRHASISLMPGGKVLELMTRHGLGMT
ncbi:hypothetical protein [Azonexus sp.]|uniref:hypothetical protein n=1 Tax=Azonexus sp. TaxID=1872668 RepID=UPI0035ADA709